MRGRAGEPSLAKNNLSHTANQAVRDLMAAQTQTNIVRERQCRRRLASLCQSRSRHGRGRPGPQSRGWVGREGERVRRACLQWCNYTSEKPLPVAMGLAELLVPWLLSAVEGRFGSHVSTCAKVISPTSASCSHWRQCLLRTEAFE